MRGKPFLMILFIGHRKYSVRLILSMNLKYKNKFCFTAAKDDTHKLTMKATMVCA